MMRPEASASKRSPSSKQRRGRHPLGVYCWPGLAEISTAGGYGHHGRFYACGGRPASLRRLLKDTLSLQRLSENVFCVVM